MKRGETRDYSDLLKTRIVLYGILLLLMIVYNVAVGELGLGDSRYMSQLADTVSRLIYFGGLTYVIVKIVFWKKLLKDERRMQAELSWEADERRRLVHLKSGGIVFDLLLFVLLFMTCTTALYSEEAFRACLLILLAAVSLKAVSRIVYNKTC